MGSVDRVFGEVGGHRFLNSRENRIVFKTLRPGSHNLSTKAALGPAVCRKNQKLFWPISTFIIVSWKVLGRRVERTALKHRLPCAPCGRPQPLATVPAKRYPRPILIKNHRHMAPHASHISQANRKQSDLPRRPLIIAAIWANLIQATSIPKSRFSKPR